MNRLDALVALNEQVLNVRLRRQELIASNIANADTPSYKARDLDFRSALARALGESEAAAPARTSERHLAAGGSAGGAGPALYRTPLQPSLDGNSVEMDTERAHFTDNAARIEASMQFISGKFKSLLAAIQG